MANTSSQEGTADEHLWRATFSEFTHQALRSFQSNVFDIASGGWVEVGLAAPGNVGGGSDAWPQHQWYIAYEILASLDI